MANAKSGVKLSIMAWTLFAEERNIEHDIDAEQQARILP
jgi:hypothetical protein